MKNNSDYKYTAHLSADDMLNLRKGLLSAADKQEKQAHIDNCELCHEAMEGLLLLPQPMVIKNLPKTWKAKQAKSARHKPLAPGFNIPVVIITAAVLIICSVGAFYFIKNTGLKNTQPSDVVSNSSPKYREEQNKETSLYNNTNKIDTTEKPSTPMENDQIPQRIEVTPLPEKEITLRDSNLIANIKGSTPMGGDISYINGYKVVSFAPTSANRVQFNIPAIYRNEVDGLKQTKDEFNDTQRNYYAVLQMGLFYLKKHDSEGAMDMFDAILHELPNDENAVFYKALLYAKAHKNSQAILLYKQFDTKPESTFYEESQYHKAKCMYEDGDKVEAIKIFKLIVARQGFYAASARSFLNEH